MKIYINYRKSFCISKLFIFLAFFCFASSSFASTCSALLGPIPANLLPAGTVATVTYADYYPKKFFLDPITNEQKESATDPLTTTCFVAVTIDADTSEPGNAFYPRNEFKLDLTLPPNWNNKFMMTGQGGYAGARSNLTATTGSTVMGAPSPYSRGYAVATTNAGNSGLRAYGDPLLGDFFLIDKPGVNNEPEINFSYRAVHLATVIGKALTEQYYNSPIQFAYFGGFSRGGNEALMEAARYPDDYNGIIAGAPTNLSGMFAHWIKVTQMQYPNDYPAGLTNPLMEIPDYTLVYSQFLAKCDGLDGIVDGEVRDPTVCKFNVKKDIPSCPNDVMNRGVCLTKAQKDLVETMNSPIQLSSKVQDGEHELSMLPYEWSDWVGDPVNYPYLGGISNMGTYYVYSLGLIKYVIADNADANVIGLPVTKENLSLLTGFDVPRDLSAFFAKGGKLIMHQGWDDGAVSPINTLNFYLDITNGVKNKDSMVRLFMRPGFDHGESLYWYPGARWDILTPLENWVEHGVAPNQIEVATGAADFSGNPGTIDRPVCPYPQVAVQINPNIPDPNYANYECKNLKNAADNNSN